MKEGTFGSFREYCADFCVQFHRTDLHSEIIEYKYPLVVGELVQIAQRSHFDEF